MRHFYQLWAYHRQDICRMDMHSTLSVHCQSHIWNHTCYYWKHKHKWNFLVVAEPNWEQFSIYLHFNCTIAWIPTYLVLLYPKDQTVTLKTQKYLIKLNHLEPLANLSNIYAVAQQSISHHIHSVPMVIFRNMTYWAQLWSIHHTFSVIAAIKLFKT